ncbi:hypothetical protein [uncultured Lamprocystis sp.]|jgi:hypothetical protein|uniref:hypothetical protein n=1 Tax=uncultured Lamprocystis sp. TaxID=543132 RepID=UPI0025F8D723|nr:hypothetical protein [uncultured Lamprocystis sp.]
MHPFVCSAVKTRRIKILSLILVAVMTPPAIAQPLATQTLGHKPLCEPSAALIIDCPDKHGRCLLVGDNEIREALLLFDVTGSGVDPNSQRPLALDDATELSDIEALASLPNSGIGVFASHGRNSDCEAKKNRRRFGVIDTLTTTPVAVTVTESKRIDCAGLFGSSTPDEALIKSVCAAITEAEQAADAVVAKAGGKPQCNETHAYNAEGAVNFSDTAAADLWIGLRSPLLPVHPTDNGRRNLAVLMHMQGVGAYSFDRIAILDMGGRGIRDLAYGDGWVWVIAGPPEDQAEGSEQPFELRRFSPDALKAGTTIVPEVINRNLPPSSEGLAIFNHQAIVLVDGDAGDDDASSACGRDAKVVMIPLAHEP